MSAAAMHGGPAADQTFTGLGRLPAFVRVVEGPPGLFDILNELDDEPKATEQVVAVYLRDDTSQVFACRPGPGEIWTYVFVPQAQPRALRTEELWTDRLAAITGVPVEVIREQRATERAAGIAA